MNGWDAFGIRKFRIRRPEEKDVRLKWREKIKILDWREKRTTAVTTMLGGFIKSNTVVIGNGYEKRRRNGPFMYTERPLRTSVAFEAASNQKG